MARLSLSVLEGCSMRAFIAVVRNAIFQMSCKAQIGRVCTTALTLKFKSSALQLPVLFM